MKKDINIKFECSTTTTVATATATTTTTTIRVKGVARISTPPTIYQNLSIENNGGKMTENAMRHIQLI